MQFLKSTLGWAIGGDPDDPNNGNNEANDTKNTNTEKNEIDPNDEVKRPEGEPEAGSVGSTLWSLLSSKLGTDVLVSGISLPSWLYEPLTILQRQAEMIEHALVLNEAAKCDDPFERFAYVCAFAVSGYSATQRYKPNFNPILGETFEFVDQKNGTKFFAEQVTHHPPMSALQAENKAGWKFWQNSCATTKFLGNSIDVDTHGHSHVFFEDTQDHFFYTNPQTRVHNVILGTMWIEHFGVLAFRNLNGSTSAVINFTKSSLWQGTNYKISGYIFDSSNKKCVKLEGKWHLYLDGTWLVDTAKNTKGTKKRFWEMREADTKRNELHLTPFASSLNKFEGLMNQILLPTDSRRRLDRQYLEMGDSDTATAWKKIMEERQRRDRKKRTEQWKPLWFKKIPDDTHETKSMWVYCGDYWEQRDKKVSLLENGCVEEASKFLCPLEVKGLACDFLSYDTDPQNNLEVLKIHDSPQPETPEPYIENTTTCTDIQPPPEETPQRDTDKPTSGDPSDVQDPPDLADTNGKEETL